jgi:hypothetical protein
MHQWVNICAPYIRNNITKTLLIAGTLNVYAWESAAKFKIMKQIDYTGFKTEAFTVIKRSHASK